MHDTSHHSDSRTLYRIQNRALNEQRPVQSSNVSAPPKKLLGDLEPEKPAWNRDTNPKHMRDASAEVCEETSGVHAGRMYKSAVYACWWMGVLFDALLSSVTGEGEVGQRTCQARTVLFCTMLADVLLFDVRTPSQVLICVAIDMNRWMREADKRRKPPPWAQANSSNAVSR